MADLERRYTLVPVELRAAGDQPKIGGYADRVQQRISQNLGGFVERADPALVNDARGNGWPEVMARYNHDDNQLLGTTAAGTLRLRRRRAPAWTTTSIPPNARADVVELVERGDVRKSSFAFRVSPGGDDWDAVRPGVSDADAAERCSSSTSPPSTPPPTPTPPPGCGRWPTSSTPRRGGPLAGRRERAAPVLRQDRGRDAGRRSRSRCSARPRGWRCWRRKTPGRSAASGVVGRHPLPPEPALPHPPRDRRGRAPPIATGLPPNPVTRGRAPPIAHPTEPKEG